MDNDFARNARIHLGITTTELAQMLHVTKRTVELWESGTQAMPLAKRDLLAHKVMLEHQEPRGLVVVLSDDRQSPLAVLASDLYLSCDFNEIRPTIRALGINRENGRPHVYPITFLANANSHVLEAIRKWEAKKDEH